MAKGTHSSQTGLSGDALEASIAAFNAKKALEEPAAPENEALLEQASDSLLPSGLIADAFKVNGFTDEQNSSLEAQARMEQDIQNGRDLSKVEAQAIQLQLMDAWDASEAASELSTGRGSDFGSGQGTFDGSAYPRAIQMVDAIATDRYKSFERGAGGLMENIAYRQVSANARPVDPLVHRAIELSTPQILRNMTVKTAQESLTSVINPVKPEGTNREVLRYTNATRARAIQVLREDANKNNETSRRSKTLLRTIANNNPVVR